jgi:hypothetical protein
MNNVVAVSGHDYTPVCAAFEYHFISSMAPFRDVFFRDGATTFSASLDSRDSTVAETCSGPLLQ